MNKFVLAVAFILVAGAITFRSRIPWGGNISGSDSRPAASSEERKPPALTAEEMQRKKTKLQVIVVILLIVAVVFVNVFFIPLVVLAVACGIVYCVYVLIFY